MRVRKHLSEAKSWRKIREIHQTTFQAPNVKCQAPGLENSEPPKTAVPSHFIPTPDLLAILGSLTLPCSEPPRLCKKTQQKRTF